MKDISTLTIKLLLICAIVAALLAFVNQVTEPIIAVNNQKTFETAMSEVLPEGAPFSEIDSEKMASFTPSESGVVLESIYRGDNNSGYVVSTVCSEGYGGDISVMVGISDDLKVNQAKVMSMSETPGLGAKSQTSEFIDQYNGLGGGIQVVKNTVPADGEIQAISGATITSKAVTKAINAAIEAAEYAEGGQNK